MNIEQALKPIAPVIGVSSLIGAPNSISSQLYGKEGLDKAKQKLQDIITAQDNCQSDYAYWGYEGQKSYWRAVVNILEASQLVGEDNLPDVAPPDTSNSVVMDACSKIENYGEKILNLTKTQYSQNDKNTNLHDELLPIDLALPEFLLKAEQYCGNITKDISFEKLDIEEQNDFMEKSSCLITMLKPYLK